jgi:hypothetical protein
MVGDRDDGHLIVSWRERDGRRGTRRGRSVAREEERGVDGKERGSECIAGIIQGPGKAQSATE